MSSVRQKMAATHKAQNKQFEADKRGFCHFKNLQQRLSLWLKRLKRLRKRLKKLPQPLKSQNCKTAKTAKLKTSI